MIQGEMLHYRILEQIGEGGMGIVVKALDTHLDRPVAIKAIHERLLSDSRAKVRLRREGVNRSPFHLQGLRADRT